MPVHAVYILNTEARCKDSNLDPFTQFRVYGNSPFDFKVASKLRHEVVDIVHFLHHEARIVVLFIAEINAQQNLLGVEDVVVVQQWRVQCIVDSLLHTAFAFAITCAHNGHSAVFKHRLDIVEVEIDKSMVGDYLCNALRCNAQCIVGLAECIENCKVGINLPQAFVVDYQ